MKIGELAKATGLTTKTIRFYEGEGLITNPPRTPSGYRRYGPKDLDRLDFILKAKRLGLSLPDIKNVLYLHDRNEPTCEHVRSVLVEKLAQVDQALQDLQVFRMELMRLWDESQTIVDCKPLGGRICSIIEQSGLSTSDSIAAWVEPITAQRR